MNTDTMKGQWAQLKGTVKQQWGKLTDDDLLVIEGNREQLIGKVQERYGHTRDVAQKRSRTSTTPTSGAGSQLNH